jgi:RNA polymerase sigma-70 factor (ECF subfamily)
MRDSRQRVADVWLDHDRWLRGLVRGLVRDRDVREVVLLESWIAAWRAPPSTAREPRPWLARVARNAARMRGRGDARRARRERIAASGPDVESPETLVQRTELRRVLVELVERLEEPYRTTLELRYCEGLSAAEIAERQGVPAGTVRWRIKRALEQLRAELERRTGEGRSAWGVAALLGAPRAGASGAVAKRVITMSIGKVVGIGVVGVAALLATGFGAWVRRPPPRVAASERATPRAPAAHTEPASAPRDRDGRGQRIGGRSGEAPSNIGLPSKAEMLRSFADAWRNEPVDGAWARSMEEHIRGRVTRHGGISLGADDVECRSRCCAVRLTRSQYDGLQQDFLSSVGIGDLQPEQIVRPARAATDGDAVATICFTREGQPRPEDLPDRGAERARLLERAAPALAMCAAQADEAFLVDLVLILDRDGAVSDLKSSADYAGTRPARCAEQAILAAAAFAPAPVETKVPVTIRLEPRDDR